MTRHQRLTRNARRRSSWIEDVRTGRVVVPAPLPLFSPLRRQCFREGLNQRETRLVEQRALVQRLLANAGRRR